MPAPVDKSDVELLLDYSRGKSHAAFEALVQRHGSMVHGVARRILSNHHDAEEVTQATFLVLAREASKLSKGHSLAGWLHTVARRLSLNALKSRKTCEAREQAAMKEESSTDTPSAELQAEFGRELDDALSRLPERYRQPLVLFHLEGASIEEASQKLRLHSGTFRTRLGRARAMLRDALERRGVKIASVGVLAGMLTAESKAASLGASATHGISEAVLGKGSLGAGAQSLADGLAGVHGLSSSALSTSIITIMKTKASIIAAAVVAAAALIAFLKLGSEEHANDYLNRDANREDRRLDDRGSNSLRLKRSSNRGSAALSEIATQEDFMHLITAVFLIADEGQRLRAIRERLGMDISDQVYHLALEECRYAVEPKKQFEILCQKWAGSDGLAGVQWAQQLTGEMGQAIREPMLWLWMAQDEDGASAWASANLEPSRLENVRMMAETRGKMLSLPPDQLAGYLESLHVSLESNKGPNAPDQLARYLESLHVSLESNKGPNALDQAIAHIGHKNPEATLEFIKSHNLNEQEGFGRGIQIFFKRWAGRDPDAALAAASKHLEGEQRQQVLLQMLTCWQTKYPHRPLEEVADLNQFSDEQYQQLEMAVAGIQAQVNPERALRRAMQAESPERVEEMLNVVIQVRAYLAEDEIRDWVSALPEGEHKDMSLASLARAVSGYDLEGGAALVSQISNPKCRDETVIDLLKRNYPQDGELEVSMRLADQVRLIPVDQMLRYSFAGNADEIPVFIDWLRKRRAEGRIKDGHVEQMDELIGSLEQRLKELK